MTATFEQIYGRAPEVRASAPGRVNLIGEHTDYNDGFVLPAAIPQRTHVALARRDDERFRVSSAEFAHDEPVEFPVNVNGRVGDWADYVRGIVWALRDGGISCGADLHLTSEVPVGSGLSSSAALLVAVGRALRSAYDLPIDDVQLAVMARKAETDFVGAPVGIMDQMACSLADAQNALFIDTRSLAFERVALPPACALMVIDSGIRHSHASGDYRVRRDECHRAAGLLGVPALRDVAETEMSRVEALPPPLNRRARHVVTENARVVATVEALRRGDVRRAGALFLESHASMRDDFEVSIPEIDALVAAAQRVQGVYGARLTGGGFGGAIVALVEPSRTADAARIVIGQQHERFGAHPRVIVPAAHFLESSRA
jgi:galactokinase